MKISMNIPLACITAVLLCFSACAKEEIYVDDLEDESPLSIYLLQNADYGMEDFVWRYNVAKPNDNRKIEITKFKYDAFYNNAFNILVYFVIALGITIIDKNKLVLIGD